MLAAFAPFAIVILFARPLIHMGLWAFHAATLLCAAWGIAFSLLWWNTLDEARKEAHKFAWAWGGTFGMVFAIAAIIVMEAFRPLGDFVDQASRSLPGWRPGPAGLLYGIMFTVLAQMLGYTIVWIGWWAAARKPR